MESSRVRNILERAKSFVGTVLRARGVIHDLEFYREFPSLLESERGRKIVQLSFTALKVRGTLGSISGNWLRSDANEAIREAVEDGKPFMAARLGRGEIRFLSKVMLRRECGLTEKMVNHWIEGTDLLWSGKDGWFKQQLNGSIVRAGEFFDAYVQSMEKVDIFGSWSPGESLFSQYLSGCRVDSLASLEPYYHSKPWSSSLEGKRVLVVHPFAKTLASQYQNNRTHLFQDPSVLPKFELTTLIPFMEGIRNPAKGLDLIAQFRILASEISRVEADVVLIGAGPLGFLLAAEAKNQGNVAIHLGGATQVLFGVRGKRWDEMENFDFINEYWVRPRSDEQPVDPVGRYDNGAYW